jgi:hypothetical protein
LHGIIIKLLSPFWLHFLLCKRVVLYCLL